MKKSFFNKPIFGILIILSFFIVTKQFDSCSCGPKNYNSAVYSVAFKNKISSIDEGRGIYITLDGDKTWYHVSGFYNHRKNIPLYYVFKRGDSIIKNKESDFLYLKKRSGEIDTFYYDY